MRTLKEIREYCEKATDGPWKAQIDQYGDCGGIWPSGIDAVIKARPVDSEEAKLSISEADAEFCAHARTDLPLLVEQLELHEEFVVWVASRRPHIIPDESGRYCCNCHSVDYRVFETRADTPHDALWALFLKERQG